MARPTTPRRRPFWVKCQRTGQRLRARQEALYRTAKGAHFLAGEGGARTKYAENIGGAVFGGSKIMPLTEAEALAWGERHMDTDAVAEHFAHMVEEA